MSETALVSLSKIKLRSMLNSKVKGADTIKKLKDDSHTLLSTILIGNNLVNVGAAALATSLAFQLFENYAVAISTGAMTLLVLVFGEIIPKSYATHHDEKVSLFIAKPILILSYVLMPIIWVLDKVTGTFVKPKKNPVITEEDLEACVELGKKEGFIKDVEKDLIHNIFKFDEISVSEIMTPRHDMFSIDVNKSLDKVLPSIVKANYTRIPVYEKNLNKVVGILNMKDLVPLLRKKKATIRQIMYTPFFVPENIKLDDLLHQFKKRKEHMAIVVDEHGLVVGLVTLENVLEEIVGEIKDETDKINPHVSKVGVNLWNVLGKSDIDEVNKKIGSSFEESEDYDTISGMVLHKIGTIPREGDKVVFGRYVLEITDVEENRIVRVKIRRK